MTRLEHLLTIVGEEAAEVIQRATKAQRFGLGEIQDEQDLDNRTRLLHEFWDLVTALELMLIEDAGRRGVFPPPEMLPPTDYVLAKRARIEKMMERSRLCGTLKEALAEAEALTGALTGKPKP